ATKRNAAIVEAPLGRRPRVQVLLVRLREVGGRLLDGLEPQRKTRLTWLRNSPPRIRSIGPPFEPPAIEIADEMQRHRAADRSECNTDGLSGYRARRTNDETRPSIYAGTIPYSYVGSAQTVVCHRRQQPLE